MAILNKLNNPWMIAVWPGMGSVALTAGYYLMAKLGMHQLAEFSAEGLFDVDSVSVEEGLIQPTQRPRSRLFVWRGPAGKRDIVVFIGEAQPPLGKYAFCERLIELAVQLGTERIFTFAAMATAMHPKRNSRAFVAATEEHLLQEFQLSPLEPLKEGSIGGLNGVLLGVAKDKRLPGICLLGEMPHIFSQVPYPKASMVVLKNFASLAGVDIDLSELAEQAADVDRTLSKFADELQATLNEQDSQSEEEAYPEPIDAIPTDDEQMIERLFADATQDRSKAYELKRELDRLDLFSRYEDRFLDLFKTAD
jgi:uncharacterized protein